MITGDNMANREKRRKENKKEVTTTVVEENNGITNIVKITAIVLGILVVFYLITYFATYKSTKKKEEDNTPVFIQYEEITTESTFKMPKNEYYVLFYDFTSLDSFVFNSIYDEKKSIYKIYKVDLAKGFNTPYINKEGNPGANQLSELKINGPTIIKIKDGVNNGYGEGVSAILNILK
jgi:hypothetical protein